MYYAPYAFKGKLFEYTIHLNAMEKLKIEWSGRQSLQCRILSGMINFPIILILSTSPVWGQNKIPTSRKLANASYYRLLIGKYYSEKDSDWIVQFTESECSYTSPADTSNLHFIYKLSSSCKLEDSIRDQSYNKKIHLLLFYPENSGLNECDEIEKLDGKNLTWFNNGVGKYFVFKKIARGENHSVK